MGKRRREKAIARRSLIWFADVVEAFESLRPGNDRTRDVIVRALGLSRSREKVLLRKPDEIVEPGKPGGSSPPPIPPDEEGDGKPISRGHLRPKTLRPVAHETGKPSASWGTSKRLEGPRTDSAGRVLPYVPLFQSRLRRDLLAAVLSTDLGNGPVDVRRVVERVARLQPVREVPRLPWRSLHRGVEVLIDIGEGMQPFLRDEKEMFAQLRSTLGRGAVYGLAFRNCPARNAGRGPVSTWAPYKPPAGRTPLLVLTHLGIGGPIGYRERSRPEEWLEFVRRVERAGCPLAVLVPHPAERWPRILARRMRIIHWDRGTGTGEIRSRIGRCLGGPDGRRTLTG